MESLNNPTVLEQITLVVWLVVLLTVGYYHALTWFVRPPTPLLHEHPLAWALLYGICTLVTFGYAYLAELIIDENVLIHPVRIVLYGIRYCSFLVCGVFFVHTIYATFLTFKKR